jgi:hypothetical protein
MLSVMARMSSLKPRDSAAVRMVEKMRRALSSLASLLDALRGATVGAGDV